MAAVKAPKLEESDMLYEQYGKPLEAQHRGEYLAVSPQGNILIGPDLDELIDRAVEKLGVRQLHFQDRRRCRRKTAVGSTPVKVSRSDASGVDGAVAGGMAWPAPYRSRMMASISGSSIVRSRSS